MLLPRKIFFQLFAFYTTKNERANPLIIWKEGKLPESPLRQGVASWAVDCSVYDEASYILLRIPVAFKTELHSD